MLGGVGVEYSEKSTDVLYGWPFAILVVSHTKLCETLESQK